jgi:hypothetical protein
MKIKITLLLALFIITQYLFAQQAIEINQIAESMVKEKNTYPIDGTHLLEERDAEVAKFLRENPDYFEKQRLNKTSAWNFNVGDTRTWSAVNMAVSSRPNYSVPSTCRAVGTHCYIFVENSQWNNRVTQTEVNAVREAFDNKTPANPSKGIFETVVETFGEPPDVDSDPKIIILLLDIRDGYDGDGGFIAGYFSSDNEKGYNMAEIFFIDTNPANLKTQSGLDQVLGTLAHEFQHMIHWNYHRTSSNLSFINEGCSLVAEVVCGYPLYNQSWYVNETNYDLYGWRDPLSNDVLRDYSRAAKFTLYLYEQFGKDILKNIVQSTALGQNTYPNALSRTGATITFEEVLQNWFIANVVNDKTIKSEWGYSYTPIIKSNGKNYYSPNMQVGSFLNIFAVEYVSFLSGEGLEATFSTNSPAIVAKVLKEGPNKKEIVDITQGVTFSEPDFGSTYTNITFIIMNPTSTMERTYSINAKGKGKNLAVSSYYGNEPTGYYKRPEGDTICVLFDAVPGGRLDSLKVAARRVGNIVGAVYNSTGVQRPTPLGKRLSNYFTLNSTSTPPVISSSGHPYEVPYPNWVRQDFSGEQIFTDYPFAVAFGIPRDTANYAYIMSSSVPGGGFLNSYVYLTTPSSSQSPGWYYLTDGEGGGTVVFHMIAYIGFENTTEVVEVTPTFFKLEQNYPNPFNPSTKIEFTLEKAGMTRLTIYDILGRELSTLINENKDAGRHEVTFNATNYASGVYYYKLENDNIVQTKKMMLIK